MKEIQDLREQYGKGELLEQDCSANPIDQFRLWWEDALSSDEHEANAMCLSTIDEDGMPNSRIVLLKGLSDQGFTFYTNYDSRKGRELSSGKAAINFLWKSLERQVRVQGSVSKISKDKSKAYFHSRPRESQISAYASPQSKAVESKAQIRAIRASIAEQFKDLEQIPLPDNWGGYILRPSKIEFWQGRPDRFHDRIEYYQVEGGWKTRRLAP